jgi:hypothetical protein
MIDEFAPFATRHSSVSIRQSSFNYSSFPILILPYFSGQSIRRLTAYPYFIALIIEK